MWNWVGVQFQTDTTHSCLQDFKKVSRWLWTVFLRTHCGILFTLKTMGTHPADFPEGRCAQGLPPRMKWPWSPVAPAEPVLCREGKAGYHGNNFPSAFHRKREIGRDVLLEQKQLWRKSMALKWNTAGHVPRTHKVPRLILGTSKHIQ